MHCIPISRKPKETWSLAKETPSSCTGGRKMAGGMAQQGREDNRDGSRDLTLRYEGPSPC